MGRVLAVAALAVALVCAGCAGVPKLDLSSQDVAGMRLAGVKTVFPANAQVEWAEAGELEAKERQTPNAHAPRVDSAAYRSFAEHRLAAALSAQTMNAVEPLMQGSRPVRLEIHVRQLQIPTAQERTAQIVATTAVAALVGGGIVGSAAMVSTPGIFITCDVVLVDQASGWELLQVEELKASSPAFQARGEPVDSIAAALALKIKGWLTQTLAI